MRLWKNPGFRAELLALLPVCAVFAAVGFARDVFSGLLALGLGAAAVLHCAICARRRFRQMEELSADIDRILHSAGDRNLGRYAEGELSILESQISKLIITLRSQWDALKRDRLVLADALADISHQIRTPLTSLNLAAAMLAEPGLPEERRTELARDVARGLGRIEWLVEALLKLSRLDAGTVEFNLERVTAERIVKNAAEPLAIPLEVRGVELELDLDGTESFSADPAWCAEAVGNLLKNCMEHTPPGGTITVRARENALYTELTVSDTGEGFSREDLPHIFERFYRGKNADAQSAGVGLALAKTVIDRSGGVIRAGNAPGGGAVFTVRFYKGAV